MQRNMCMMNLKTSYHSAHKRSGPTNSNRSASTLLKAIRKYAKKCRICRLTLLLMIVLSALPMAEYRNLDVILWSICLYDVDWMVFFLLKLKTTNYVQFFDLLLFECHIRQNDSIVWHLVLQAFKGNFDQHSFKWRTHFFSFEWRNIVILTFCIRISSNPSSPLM